MPQVGINGVDLYYEEAGSGPPVLFSHGFLMDHEMFAEQVDALKDRYRVITWDERGHGATRATGHFDYWDSARDALALLDNLDVPEAVFVGMSQGGFLSLRAALLAPERVKALAFIDSQAGAEAPEAVPVYEAMFETWVREGPTEDMAETVAQIIIGPAETEPWKQKWMKHPSEDIALIFRTLVDREDLWDRVPEITCPTLVIHGDADAAISMDKAERLCELLPGCVGLVHISGGSHASNLSHPAEVNAALVDFLGSHA